VTLRESEINFLRMHDISIEEPIENETTIVFEELKGEDNLIRGRGGFIWWNIFS